MARKASATNTAYEQATFDLFTEWNSTDEHAIEHQQPLLEQIPSHGTDVRAESATSNNRLVEEDNVVSHRGRGRTIDEGHDGTDLPLMSDQISGGLHDDIYPNPDSGRFTVISGATGTTLRSGTARPGPGTALHRDPEAGYDLGVEGNGHVGIGTAGGSDNVGAQDTDRDQDGLDDGGRARGDGAGFLEGSGRDGSGAPVFAGPHGIEGSAHQPAVDWVPPAATVVPSSPRARARANLDAIALIRVLDAQERPATHDEQEILARYSSWGAVPQIFETWREDWAEEHRELSELLSVKEMRAASATTLNAHYTDPHVVSAVWDSLGHAGFAGGVVLEPGTGSGNFIGSAPSGARMIGVEIDPMSARIAHYLYPSARILVQGFEKTQLSAQPDLVVGNVPFGQFSLYDPIDNPHNLSIHNHFIVKALKNTAPGGYVALLTSSFTMDAARSSARQEMAKYGAFLGAVRLPTGAMSRVAGTDVMTDIVLFQRYRDGEKLGSRFGHSHEVAWTNTEFVSLTHDKGERVEVQISSYWSQHNDNVIGEFKVGHGQYNPNTVRVDHDFAKDPEKIGNLVRERLIAMMDEHAHSRPFSPTPQIAFSDQEVSSGLFTPAEQDTKVLAGTMRENNGKVEVYSGREWETPTRFTGTSSPEQLALLNIRDVAEEVLESQSTATSINERDAVRQRLGVAYDAYVAKYGAINRFTTHYRTATDTQVERIVSARSREWIDFQKAHNGLTEDLVPPVELLAQWESEARQDGAKIRKFPHLKFLREDPGFALVVALETFDEDTQSAQKSTIFFEDIVAQTPHREFTESPATAIAISLDETREVRLSRVAQLLNTSQSEAREQIRGLAFVDPVTNDLVSRISYLSGDVRSKWEDARLAAMKDTSFTENVHALDAVLPEMLRFEEIVVRAGVRYIPVSYYEAFAVDVLKATVRFEDDAVSPSWRVTGAKKSAFDPVVLHEYGTDARTPLEILQSLMNNQPIKITKKAVDNDGVERQVRDIEATALARATAEKLNDAFVSWLGQTPERRDLVEREYNARFNSHVAPDYSTLAQDLSLPGLNARITPHPYQRAAVAQIVHEPTVLLDHVVGAGKTGSMIMGAMELRRAGLARKPWLVVPNHLVEQIAADWKMWYPNAKVLTMPSDLDRVGRERMVLKSASGDWDGVVVPASAFGLIGLDKMRTARWLEEDIEKLRSNLALEKGSGRDDRAYVKKIENAIKRLEKNYEKHLASRDEGFTFEQSGCDYLFVDEAHHYKNLRRESQHEELSHAGSGRAQDLDFKLRALRETKLEALELAGKPTDGVIPSVATFATGTPVANSLSEMWVMQNYLRPDLLQSMGLPSVDAWANQFTQSTAKLELGPDGSTWRMKDRVSQFVNVPELMRISEQFTSKVDRSQIPVNMPVLRGGERGLISREPSEHVVEFIGELAVRANNLPKDKSEDNLLKITHEGRMVAIDPRTLGMEGDSDGGRVGDVATEVMRIHDMTKDTEYTNAFGVVEQERGSLQIVFLDRSTPKNSDQFTVYQALKDELVVRGMASEKIAFIHDATDDVARDQLFAHCRSGKINVLIGSTEKMGTGTNVQKRAVALHHYDVPWRPADLEQREGRILRQGNQNSEVTINRYVTEGTYDAVMWQQVARKAAFIAQIKAGSSSRSIEQLSDDMTISAAAASAIATGDPRIIERAELLHRKEQLETLKRGFDQRQRSMRAEVRQRTNDLEELTLRVGDAQKMAAAYRPTDGDHFAMKVGSQSFFDRVDAGSAVLAQMRASRLQTPDRLVVGGLEFDIQPYNEERKCVVSSVVDPRHAATVGIDEQNGMGAIRRLEYLAQRTGTSVERIQRDIDATRQWLDSMQDAHEGVFSQQNDLDDVTQRLDVIDQELEMVQDEVESSEQAVDYLSEAEFLALYGTPDKDLRKRAGDVLTHSKLVGLWEATEPQDGIWFYARRGDATDEAATRERSDLFTTVRRPHSALLDYERDILDHSGQGTRIKHYSARVGGRYTVRVTPGQVVEKEFVGQGSISWVTGVLESSKPERTKNNQHLLMWKLRLDDGTLFDGALVRDPQERGIGDYYISAHPTTQPDVLKDLRAYDLRVGDTIATDITDQQGHVLLSRGSVRTENGFRTADGDEVSRLDFASAMVAPDGFYRGTELTPEQRDVLAPTLKGSAGQLRVGDQVSILEIDKKAALDYPVIITHVDLYNDRVDLMFEGLEAFGGPTQSARMTTKRQVHITNRRLEQLTADERSVLHGSGRLVALNESIGHSLAVSGRPSNRPWEPVRTLRGVVRSYDPDERAAVIVQASDSEAIRLVHVSPYAVVPVQGTPDVGRTTIEHGHAFSPDHGQTLGR